VDPSPWSWTPAWGEVGAVLALSAAYWFGARRLGTSAPRAAAFAAGQVLLLALFTTPVETLSLHYLLSAHLLQNVALAEWAPALAVAGLSAPMADRMASFRLVRQLTRPYLALPAWLAAYGSWHVPAAYDAALRHPTTLLPLEHATYFVAGCLLWWSVLREEPWRLTAGAKAVYLFAAFVLASPLGLLFALLPDPLYSFYAAAPRIWGLSPLADQQIAGVLMAGSEAIVFFAVLAWFVAEFMREEGASYSHR
jgi:putative membrane protein